MITRLAVPHLDTNIIDVTVTAWRKAVGDRVAKGEIVAELTTDKATFEYESSGNGTLLAILAAPKSVVPSGYILALLGDPGETDGEAAACNDALMAKYRAEVGGQRPEDRGQRSEDRGQRSEVSNPQSAIRNPQSSPPPDTRHPTPSPATPRVRATPRARRLAQEQNLDLAAIQAATGAEVVDETAIQKYLGKS